MDLKFKEKLKKIPIVFISCLLLIVVCVLSLWGICKNNKMSTNASKAQITFVGEYKIGSGEWQEYYKGARIVCKDTITFKGNFIIKTPSGEKITDNPTNTNINFFLNHISVKLIVVNAENEYQKTHIFDTENKQIGKDACGEMWARYIFPKATDGLVEIEITNPHNFGNETAIIDFFDKMSLGEYYLLADELAKDYDFDRYTGIVFVAISLVLFGVAIASYFIKISGTNVFWIVGGWMLFTGMSFILDCKDVFFWNSLVVFNTTALCLSQMLSVLFLGMFISYCFSGLYKKLATISNAIIGGVIALITILALRGVGLIYDLRLYYVIAQSVCLVILFVLGVLEILKQNKRKVFVVSCGLVNLVAIVLDLIGSSVAWWEYFTVSKIVFAFTFLVAVCFGIYTVIVNYKDSIKAKNMEAELKDKNIAIMISQIQPHFLYNSLNCIAELCVTDPSRAEKATIDFARYLRGNMSVLDEKHTIEFEEELRHLSHYIALEKVRYGEDLQFEYDIQATQFTLPALTVQPLVENAVNHGIRYHKKRGKVKISSYEDKDSFVVEISDDGVGFKEEDIYADNKKHVGIANVKYRLDLMCKGKVVIDSKLGEGTTVKIIIPKEN